MQKRVERELGANNALLKRAKEKCARSTSDAKRRSDKIWSDAKDRLSGDASLAALAAGAGAGAVRDDARDDA